MAFQNQNNKQTESVNSRGFQFFNKDGFDPSTMIISFWNQQLVIKMHPAKEESKQTESSVYDYDKSINLVIPPVIAKSIANISKTKLLPALEKGEEYTVGFVVGANSVLTLSTGVKRFGTLKPYALISRGIQQGSLVAEDTQAYEFNQNMVIFNYIGEGKNEDIDFMPYYGELYYFIEVLDHMSSAILGIENHARRFVDKRFNDNVFELYKAIANHIGANFYNSNGQYSNKGTGSENPFWDNYNKSNKAQSSTASQNANVGVTPVEVDSIEGLESFMA